MGWCERGCTLLRVVDAVQVSRMSREGEACGECHEEIESLNSFCYCGGLRLLLPKRHHRCLLLRQLRLRDA